MIALRRSERLSLRSHRHDRALVSEPSAALLLDLLSDLARDDRARERRRPRWLAAVVARLHDGYREPVSFADLAADVGVHVGHLWRAFRVAEGCSPSIYLQRLRCRHVALRLARTGDRTPLAELALEAGFADQSHLNRVFKRLMGVTPGGLRRTLRRAGSDETVRTPVAGAARPAPAGRP